MMAKKKNSFKMALESIRNSQFNFFFIIVLDFQLKKEKNQETKEIYQKL